MITSYRHSAKYFIQNRIDNGMYEVEWSWEHQNHDLFSLQDMKPLRGSGPLKDWAIRKGSFWHDPAYITQLVTQLGLDQGNSHTPFIS